MKLQTEFDIELILYLIMNEDRGVHHNYFQYWSKYSIRLLPLLIQKNSTEKHPSIRTGREPASVTNRV